MAKALQITIKESLSALKNVLKSTPQHLLPRIKMLILIKKGEINPTKNGIAEALLVNHNSVQSWRKKYIHGGLKELIKFDRRSNKKSVVRPATHKAIELKMNNPEGAFTSYKDLHNWVEKEFEKGILYNTLRHYVKREFGASLKVARKSNIKKDKGAALAFKKTLVKSVKKK